MQYDTQTQPEATEAQVLNAVQADVQHVLDAAGANVQQAAQQPAPAPEASALPCYDTMAILRRSQQSYRMGSLTLKRAGKRFTLEGDVDPSNLGSDHFQLIFEALSMAADSDDPFKQDFALMLSELTEQSADWPEQS